MKIRDSRGYALLAVVVISAVLLTTAAAVIRMTRSELHRSADDVAAERAFYVAEAGVERGLVQLYNDRATASTLSAYRFPSSGTSPESYGGSGGQNAIVVDRDPLFVDPRRKRITSTGTVAGQNATVVARAFVQAGNPFTTSGGCPVLYSDTGSARLLINVAALTGDLLATNTEIFSNNDVVFQNLVGLAVNSRGVVNARGNFVDSSTLSLLVNLPNMSLNRGGSYAAAPIHLHLLGLCASPLLGVHFGNGSCGHGAVSAIPARTMPVIDYDSIRNDPATVVVNKNNVPFGTWHAASGTWLHSGLLSFPANAQTIYYVEGNASLDSLQILREVDATIVTRGWLRVGTVSLLNTDLVPLVADKQDLRLIGEGDVVVGRNLLAPLTPPADDLLTNLVSESATLSSLLGFGTGTIEVADTNRIFVFSERGGAWVKAGTAQALSRTNACIMAKNDASLATTASILSSIGPVTPPYFP